MKRYRKTIVALIAGLGGWGVTASADGTYDQAELWGLLVVLTGAYGVYQVRNARKP